MAYELRPVQTAEDWAALHGIRRETLFAPERHPGVVYDADNPDDRSPNNVPCLLLLDGRPIGVVRIDFRGPDAVVRLVAILSALQGVGNGRAMSDLIDAEARRRGVRRLLVNAYHGAVGFYERTGWQREVWDASELMGIASDCIQMVKRL